MLNRKRITILSIACMSAALILTSAPATAPASSTVVGHVKNHVDGNIFDFAHVKSRWVRKPRRRSLSVVIKAVPDDAAQSDQITISGGMTCPGKGGGAHEVGVHLKHVATPFRRIVPFPFRAKHPRRCRVNVAFVNFDPKPPLDPIYPFNVPAGTITITIKWRH